MGCRNCISPRICVNYDETKCKDCEKYENAVPVGKQLLPDANCFKCKFEDTCVGNKENGGAEK